MTCKCIDKSKIYIVTGAAGFIGYFLSKKLLQLGCRVIGLDNLNQYYDVNLKYARLENLEFYEGFILIKGDISDKEVVLKIFDKYKPDVVVNLAAQAGVRYSIENPDAYIRTNINGFYNILEACRYNPVDHLVYASSSSVYGANRDVPFKEKDFVDNPLSLYAATKKSNELMAYTYSNGKIQKYGVWGLILFVAVPLPGTGVWSGSMAAALLNMRFKWAFPAILVGNLIAGGLIMGISDGILRIFGR